MGFFKRFVKALTKPETLITAALMAVINPVAGLSKLASAAIYAAGTAAMSALSPVPELPDFSSFTSQSQNRRQMIKQPTQARRAVYGTVRVSGLLAHIESTNSDRYLHLVVALASHEVQSISAIRLNDVELTLDGNGNCTSPSRYAGLVRIKTHSGTDNQIADTDLVSESESGWTSEHRLRGVAYLYARLDFDRDAFPNGIPTITALVSGKKVFDPRNSGTAFSANAALCIRDYLTDTRYGVGASSSEINDTSFTTAANLCDENVTLAAGGTEKRYEFHGTIESAEQPKRTIEQILTSCGGVLFYTNGQFNLKAAGYVSPTITLDEGDAIAGLQLQTKQSIRDNFNAVKGVFSPATTDYVAADYPAFQSSTFLAEDNNQLKFLEFNLPYTTSAAMAQRLAKIALFRNRQQVVLNGTFNLKAFQLNVGDTVQITNSKFGFTNKIFEVAQWDIQADAGNVGVSLQLRETNSAVYDWNAEEAVFAQDNTNLPDPFDIPAPSIVASDELQIFNEKALSVLVANVTSGNTFAQQFEVQAKKSTDTDFISIGTSSSNKFELVDVEDGVIYDVRARVITALGVRSPFATVQHQIVGKTAPPADVTDFSVNIIGTEAALSWTPTTDLDLSHYIIRHSRATSGATYSNSVTLAEKISRPANTATVPAMTGTYFIKSVDKLGLASENATSSVAIIEEIKGFNSVQTSTQSPSFSGAKTNCVATTDNALVMDTTVNFDSASGNFDDAAGLFDGGGGSVQSTGTYEFDSPVDLGAVYTSHVTANITVERVEYLTLFDSTQGNFDDRTGTFDGDVQAFDDTNVELQIATTEDDPNSGSPTYTAFRKFFVGDYKARGFKFKAILSSSDAQASPKITALSVSIDMPDRTLAESDIASGTGTKTITFSPAFKSLQGLGIAAQNLQSGDFYVITSKSATGFTIQFFNSSSAGVDRTFDYVAQGFGEVAA